MPDKPSAEFEIDEALVRTLVASQAAIIPDAAILPLEHAADGWDCSVWRLGDDLAVRLPRRALAAPLVLHEQQVLTGIAARLARSGVGLGPSSSLRILSATASASCEISRAPER